ncbi:MAG: YihY/virulence factor BrkB family protein [Limisphaerales bacterium]
MSKGIFKKVKAILTEDFSSHHLSTGGKGTLSTIERFIHFWVFAIKSFVRNRCMVRASALAYSNLLALVPMLAIAISVSATLLKENGKENQRIDRLITWVVHAIVPKGEEAKTEESLDKTTHDAVKTQINQFISNIRGGALSSSGMILLIVIVILMLARIEDTLNDIWGVKKGRSWFARIITYWFAMTFGPLLLLAAITLNSGQQMTAFIEQLSHWPSPFNEIFGFLAKSAPFILLSFGFSVFYKFMPNTKVQWRASLVGGICGGTLWQVNNLLFVFYVSRIVTNNKIYGSLGMIPVVMISLYLGWLFLLFGAQFAYAFQNRRAYVQDRLIESLTPRGREVVAL